MPISSPWPSAQLLVRFFNSCSYFIFCSLIFLRCPPLDVLARSQICSMHRTHPILSAFFLFVGTGKRAKIHEIYRFVEQHASRKDGLPLNWKLAIRHNLSSRARFSKNNEGCTSRNSWWCLTDTRP
eukprot:m.645173 g.645173  ORF g.645173 m.645173 type:complete len:126 (-) comp58354_c0_seq6:399-776(-)